MKYPLAVLSVGLVSIPLLFVVWRMVKAPIRTRDLVFLDLLALIFLIPSASELVGPWVTNLIYILAGVSTGLRPAAGFAAPVGRALFCRQAVG